MNRTKWMVAFALAAGLAGTAAAQRPGVNVYVPPTPPPPPPVQVPPPPAPVSPAMSTVVTPASLEERVRQLQEAVADLQGQVQALQARMPPADDSIVSYRSPSPGLRCDATALLPANDILERAYRLEDYRRPYPDSTLVLMWTNCRR